MLSLSPGGDEDYMLAMSAAGSFCVPEDEGAEGSGTGGGDTLVRASGLEEDEENQNWWGHLRMLDEEERWS